jgi:hypothetical protein
MGADLAKFAVSGDHFPFRAAELRRDSTTRQLSRDEHREFRDATLSPSEAAPPGARAGEQARKASAEVRPPVRPPASDAESQDDAEDEDDEEEQPEEREAYAYKHTYPMPKGKGLAQHVRDLWRTSQMKFSKVKPAWYQNERGWVVFVYCRSHKEVEGSAMGPECPFAAKYMHVGGSVHYFERGTGQHFANRSLSLIRKLRRVRKDAMVNSPDSVSSQRRQAFDRGEKAADLPASAAVYKGRTSARQQLRQSGGVSVEEFREIVQRYASTAASGFTDLRLDENTYDADGKRAGFYAECLRTAALEFAARTEGGLRLVADATHEFGLQNWKLLCIGFAGVHWERNEYRATLIPVAFVVSKEEDGPACDILVAIFKAYPRLSRAE